MLRDKALSAEKFKRSQRKKEHWERCKEHKQGSTIEVLTLNGRQNQKLSGQPSKRRMRRLVRKNKTVKATLRQINKVERVVLMVNNLSNNITDTLEKNELWIRKLSVCQHSSPTSRFAKLRLNKRYKPGD